MMSRFFVLFLILSCACPVHSKTTVAKKTITPGKLVRFDTTRSSVDCPLPIDAAMDPPNGMLPPPGPTWQIHDKGVGELWIGESLPPAVFEKEGGDPIQDFMNRAQGLDSNALLNQGLVNQAGYPVIRLKSLEITLSFAQGWRVLSIEPGPSIRTHKGTGKGSSLAELKRAHGHFKLYQGPEPYHCVATVPDIRFLGFRFSDCSAACQGERAQSVTVGKPNYDFMEQRWLQQPSRSVAPEPNKKLPSKEH